MTRPYQNKDKTYNWIRLDSDIKAVIKTIKSRLQEGILHYYLEKSKTEYINCLSKPQLDMLSNISQNIPDFYENVRKILMYPCKSHIEEFLYHLRTVYENFITDVLRNNAYDEQDHKKLYALWKEIKENVILPVTNSLCVKLFIEKN